MITFKNQINNIYQGWTLFKGEPHRPPFIIKNGYGWHYTSMQNAYRILESDSIFSTEYGGLNDHTEITHGIEIIKDQFKVNLNSPNVSKNCKQLMANWIDKFEHLTHHENLYFISASRDSTTPSQWALYGDHGYGVCIGLDLSQEIRPFQPQENFGINYSGLAISWLRTIYKDTIKRKTVLHHINEIEKYFGHPQHSLDQDTFNFITLMIAATFKDHSFSSEKEVRALYYAHAIEASVTLSSPHLRKIEPWYGVKYGSDGQFTKGTLPVKALKVGPRASLGDLESFGIIEICNKRKIKIIK